VDSSTKCSEIEIICEDATSTYMPELGFPEAGEVKNITDCECSTDFVEGSEKDILIAELNNKPSAVLANIEESEPGLVVSKLQNLSLVAFYTGFPNYQTMMALYDFLNAGEHGENINYFGCREKMLIVPPSL